MRMTQKQKEKLLENMFLVSPKETRMQGIIPFINGTWNPSMAAIETADIEEVKEVKPSTEPETRERTGEKRK